MKSKQNTDYAVKSILFFLATATSIALGIFYIPFGLMAGTAFTTFAVIYYITSRYYLEETEIGVTVLLFLACFFTFFISFIFAIFDIVEADATRYQTAEQMVIEYPELEYKIAEIKKDGKMSFNEFEALSSEYTRLQNDKNQISAKQSFFTKSLEAK
jgi:di/tricarboxylate transporter